MTAGTPDTGDFWARRKAAVRAEDLAAKGVEHIHFYSMNKSPITVDVCNALGHKAEAA